MSALPAALTVAAACTGLLHVRAEYRGPRRMVYACKPLTTTLILALALSHAVPVSPAYRAAVVLGLVCSLAGDVVLMLPADRFLQGVASFLLAHVAYLVAFTRDAALGAVPWLLAPCALLGAVMLALLWPGLGRMKVPVVVYLLVILAMLWQALGRGLTIGATGAWLAAAGATLFVVSDAALALDRFRKPYRAAQAVILPTYYAAQLLIAWSVRAG
jgi:uncharacterized membrane protein YhhN